MYIDHVFVGETMNSAERKCHEESNTVPITHRRYDSSVKKVLKPVDTINYTCFRGLGCHTVCFAVDHGSTKQRSIVQGTLPARDYNIYSTSKR
jgi:hypothetical protein